MKWIEKSPDWIQITAAAEIRYDLDADRGFLGHLTDARNSAVHRALTASLDTPGAESALGRDEMSLG